MENAWTRPVTLNQDTASDTSQGLRFLEKNKHFYSIRGGHSEYRL